MLKKATDFIEDCRILGFRSVMCEEITYMLLRGVQILNPHKNRTLSYNLQELAKDYDPRYEP